MMQRMVTLFMATILLMALGGRARAAIFADKAALADQVMAMPRPRLVMTKAQVDAFKQRLTTDPATQSLLDAAKQEALNGDELAAAVVYAVTGDIQYANIAKGLIVSRPTYKGFGNALNEGAWVYDLIFPALTQSEINTFHAAILPSTAETSLLSDRRGGMNLIALLALIGDGVDDAVLKDRLVFVLGWLETDVIPFLEQIADQRGGTYQSLGGCACARHKHAELFSMLSNTLGIGLFADPYRYMSQLYFYHTFILRPGLQKWPSPETGPHDTRVGTWDEWSFQSTNHSVVAARSRNGLARWYTEQSQTFPAWREVAGWWDKSVPVVQPSELPLDSCFKGMGWTVARGGWGPDDVYVLFISGMHTIDSAHSDLFRRNNQFLIYKGQKRLDPAWTTRPEGSTSTVIMADFDQYLVPDIPVSMTNANATAPQADRPTGFREGDATSFFQGGTLAYESTPEYMYVVGDSSLDYTTSVTYRRHMVYIRPGSFIVYDSISQVNGWGKTKPAEVTNQVTITEQTGSPGMLLHFFQVDGQPATVQSTGPTSASVVIPETGRTFTFDFNADGSPGGRVTVTGGTAPAIDRALATTVEDDWRYWQNHPQFNTWQTDPKFSFLSPLTGGMLSEWINLTAPVGGETWVVNSSATVTWSAIGVTDVKIELSRDGGTTFETLVSSTPAGGSPWTWASVTGPESTTCLVRISDVANPATATTSQSFFAITGPDLTPPTITSVTTSGDPTQVVVSFSEPVEAGTGAGGAENLTNYSIPGFTVTGATLDVSGQTVTLTLSAPMTDGSIYSLTVSGINDLAAPPNPMTTPQTVSFTFVGTPVTIIAQGDTWSYFKGLSFPGATWNQIGFDDSSWLSGATGIGYGDADDATVLTDMQNNYISVYMRKSFAVTDAAAVSALTFSVDYDDGFVAFLNGTEVARRNIPSGQNNTTSATPGHEASGSSTNPVEVIDLSAFIGSLVTGTNVLAIEVHNAGIGSSDLTMIPTLDMTGGQAPPAVDTTPPSVSWDELTVAGTVDDPTITSVTVSAGMATAVTAGSFTWTLPVSAASGTVTATDAAGNIAVRMLTLTP